MLPELLIIALMQTTPDPAGEWSNMRAITPLTCICPRANGPVTIDGKLDDAAWKRAPWTSDFVDIDGSRKPAPRFRTRAKMMWDDQYLYVAAQLDEPHVVATITKKNEVIFHDNDFEIFIDPDGDNHNYYEFEMNAFGTIWELTLVKPYKDGGPANSPTNLPGLKSAVSIDGTINDPRDTDRGWSVEVALPWKDLAKHNERRDTPPKLGDVWRINFSRVQWMYDVIDGRYEKRKGRPEDNWVWTPQGIIDMHRPERWGYLVFARDASDKVANDTPDYAVKERDALMEVYHRQRMFKAKNGAWAKELSQLQIDNPAMKLESTADDYIATIAFAARDGTKFAMHVRQDSRLWWEHSP